MVNVFRSYSSPKTNIDTFLQDKATSSTQKKRRLSDSEEDFHNESTSRDAQSQTPEDAGLAEARPLKKPRTGEVLSEETEPSQPAQDGPLKELEDMVVDAPRDDHSSPFVKLPPDVLFEILVLAGSPEYVLSVMRTCKSMFSVLFHPDAHWVWKETRRRVTYRCGGPGSLPHSWGTGPFELPDLPTSFFRSEVGYASFIFDGGECLVRDAFFPSRFSLLIVPLPGMR
ncbi:hypothetical protein CVT24_005126 [Panaeolus cyanescens]|uniref:F-box domain-containing protein n=1 Tax=Panaeolus cyanescens TaxID=181874 RepID=A0A409W297_9AGAR|nr:hypothetical protein CVT24_005126 [Panaeolus cyanescens]